MKRFLLLLAGLWILSLSKFEVEGNAHVTAIFKKYRNPSGRKWNGKCCDFQLWGKRCKIKCNTYFKICLSNSPHRNSISGCSLANIKTGKLGHNDIVMQLSIGRKIPKFSGKIGLYVEVWDWDCITKDDLIDKLSVTLPVPRPSPNGRTTETYRKTLRGRRSSLQVEFKVYCNENYYGDKCTKYCQPSKAKLPNYYCDYGGNKRCHNGWYGNQCQKQCIEHDDDVNGHYRCDSSGNRFCRPGWHGDQCKKYCVSHDDDKNGHYVCDSHGNKICRTDWFGSDCKRLCRQNAIGSYICNKEGNKVCTKNWYGPLCTKFCVPRSNTLCDNNGNKVCLEGWYGEFCHVECKANNDENGHYECSSNGTKVCFEGWEAPDCKKCSKGYVPPFCQELCEPKSNNKDGHYSCDKNNKQCLMWWYGDRCQSYCVPHRDAINGHYTCDYKGQKQCIMGWYGSNCSQPCDSDVEIKECEDYQKACDSRPALPNCKKCPNGFYGNNCSLSCVGKDANITVNTKCTNDGKKTCSKWWYGEKCGDYCVPHDDDVNGHYICDTKGKKRCLIGWTGDHCTGTYDMFDSPQ